LASYSAQGGYKLLAYATNCNSSEQFTYQMLCGLTGTGKPMSCTRSARRSSSDLEGLANHRGSLLGEEWETRSSTKAKYFESLLLLQRMQGFELSQPVWVESESNKIGRVYLPQTLWQR